MNKYAAFSDFYYYLVITNFDYVNGKCMYLKINKFAA